ncbi:hypothetical protein OC846_002199 [Tilletia horrida]|uniref:Uncharacterized protein n=1 Tax=Tilletia horrida TaxID=155126 RepID=A0AAN6GSS9_9BASI|nr:hypothetical protein OC846_002199 [Tilletia horrida]
MTLAGTVLGYAGLGFATRCYALGIQRRNIFENFGGHALLMGLFGAAGYWLHGIEGRQLELIERKKEEIKANRERLAQVAPEARRRAAAALTGKFPEDAASSSSSPSPEE